MTRSTGRARHVSVAGATGPATPMDVRALALAARTLDGCRTLEEVSQAGAELATELLGARRAAVSRIEQETCRVLVMAPEPTDAKLLWLARTAMRADDRPALRGLIRDRESWVAHAVGADGQPALPGDPTAGDPIEVATLHDVDASSALASPVVVNGTVWGQLSAVRAPGAELFRADDVARAEVLAALLAGAIARVDLEAQIRHLVADDPLTGLANRRVADSAAEAALESGRETCIVMADVDGLKRVNDELGHDAGDDLLRSVADVLRRAADGLPGTVAARIGGDEFCLVTVGVRRAEVAAAVATTISTVPLAHGAAISYGIASTAVTGPVSARQLFRQADSAQYRAKRARARAAKNAVGIQADPAVTAERVVVAGSAAVAAAQSGVVPRLCALAAAVTETLGGAEWAVLMRRRDDEDPSAVARGGSPAEIGQATRTSVLEHGAWVVEIGSAEAAPTDEPVRTALDALVTVAITGAS